MEEDSTACDGAPADQLPSSKDQMPFIMQH